MKGKIRIIKYAWICVYAPVNEKTRTRKGEPSRGRLSRVVSAREW